VLGANDGLVSNLSLVAGVAGASLAAQTILITGFAGLAAGSCAMAMGEWISVQTSRELNERELRVETEELNRFPAEETDELAALYESRGLAPAGARQLAESVIANGPLALEVMARWRSRSWLARSSASIQTSWAGRRRGPQRPRSSCSASAFVPLIPFWEPL
jgi:VIT1/CCC1 family predicted Fe2+/Mn2+ transporter